MALDESGRVLVDDSDPEGEPGSGRAFVWQGGAMARLPFPDEMTSGDASRDISVGDMNDRGEVVGIATVRDPERNALFIWRGGVPTRVPSTASGLFLNAYGGLFARINNLSHVVARTENGGYLFKDGATIALGMLPVEINDEDEVLGISDFENGHVFLWKAGNKIDLGLTTARPSLLNARGDVVGHNGDNAVFVRGGVSSTIATLGGRFVFPIGLNDSGEVVGRSEVEAGTPEGPFHAFRWSAGVSHDLGTLPGGTGSAAFGINNGGQIVGSVHGSNGMEHPATWIDGAITVLPFEPPWTGSYFSGVRANWISEAGLIAGNAYGGDGSTMAYVWKMDRCAQPPDTDAGVPAPDAGRPPPPPEDEEPTE